MAGGEGACSIQLPSGKVDVNEVRLTCYHSPAHLAAAQLQS